MSIIKVANVHFETTGTNRIDYNTAGYTQIIAGGSGGIVINVGGVTLINVTPSNTNVTGNFFVNNNNISSTLASSFNSVNSAFEKANSAFNTANTALANTSGATFAGNMTVTGNLTALSYNTSSDERLKNIINTAPFGIECLEPKQYYMISQPEQIRYGFIAQEVQRIFPNLVSTDNNGFLTINYMDIIALLLIDYKKTKERLSEIEKCISKKDINTKKKGK